MHWEVAPTNAALYDKQPFEFALVPCPKMAEVTVDPVTFKDHFDRVRALVDVNVHPHTQTFPLPVYEFCNASMLDNLTLSKERGGNQAANPTLCASIACCGG